MNTNRLLNLLPAIIFGREEGDDPYERDDQNNILEEEGEKVLKEGWELDEDGKPVLIEDPEDEGNGEEDDPKKLKERADALEESLRKERTLRRKAEREARKANKGKKTPEEKKSEDDELKSKLEASEERTKKLAAGLLKTKIRESVLAEARKQGFIDETDALTEDVLSEIDADQDDEDPSDIDIDIDSVKDAVKALATKKKHLVGKGTPTERSGGKFGGKKGSGSDDPLDEAAMKERYASLR